ncbi:MAG: RNA polymerase sigma factor [Actinomycetia bacterium]|nr:RNA polymerase sigma factor [Actinomycetes bacterium]
MLGKNERIITIVKQAQQGSKQAFGELYEAYCQPLYYYAFKRLNSDAEAHDIVQETFLYLLLKIDDLRNPASFNSWIYHIASNYIYAALRIRRRETQLPTSLENDDFGLTTDADSGQESAAMVTAEEFLPEAALENAENRALLLHLIDTLTDAQKEAIILSYYIGFTAPEIASILGIKAATVDKRLHDARNALQAAFAKVSANHIADKTEALSAGKTPVLTRLLREDSAPLANASWGQMSGNLAAAIPGLLSTAASAQAATRAQGFLDLLKSGALAKATGQSRLGQALPDIKVASSSAKVGAKALLIKIGAGALASMFVVGATVAYGTVLPHPATERVAIIAPAAPAPAQQAVASTIPTSAPSAESTPPPTQSTTTAVPKNKTPVKKDTPSEPSPQAPAPTPAPAPRITVAHPQLRYPPGATLTPAQILADAGASAYDAEGAALALTLIGLENVDTQSPGTALVFACASDSADTAAETQVITLMIK